MTFMPGEIQIMYSKMPEVAQIASQGQNNPYWQYYLLNSAFQRDQQFKSQAVQESSDTSEEGVRTKSDDEDGREGRQSRNSVNKRRASVDSGRYVDITL